MTAGLSRADPTPQFTYQKSLPLTTKATPSLRRHLMRIATSACCSPRFSILLLAKLKVDGRRAQLAPKGEEEMDLHSWNTHAGVTSPPKIFSATARSGKIVRQHALASQMETK
eukprot:scaffold50_cov208-Skeletonema_menzelii.AAC.1